MGFESQEAAENYAEQAELAADRRREERLLASAEHTPGPWRVEDRRPNGGMLQIQAMHRGPLSSYCVANVNYYESPLANARLIAAAPELLQALILLHDNIAEYQRINKLGGYENHDMRLARAAINKACGT